MGDLFGGSKSSQSSSSQQGNKAYEYLTGAYSPQIGTGVAANQAQAALLGVGGRGGGAAAPASILEFANQNEGLVRAYQNLTDGGRAHLASKGYGDTFEDYAKFQIENNPDISQAYKAYGEQAAGGAGGTGGGGSGNAFENYLNSTGYKFQLGEGLKAITSNVAARGLVNSSENLRRSQEFGQGLAGNYFNQYLEQLGGLQQGGLQAGGLVSGAGQYGTSTSTGTTKNKPNVVGTIASFF